MLMIGNLPSHWGAFTSRLLRFELGFDVSHNWAEKFASSGTSHLFWKSLFSKQVLTIKQIIVPRLTK